MAEQNYKNIRELAAVRPYPWGGIADAIDDNFKIIDRNLLTLNGVINDRLENEFLNKPHLEKLLSEKQDVLKAGVNGNIKTINGMSILGSGNINIIPAKGVLYKSFFLFKTYDGEGLPKLPTALRWNPDSTGDDGLGGVDNGWVKTDNIPTPIWMICASFSSIDPNSPEITTPVKISGKDGENGADGSNIEFLYKLDDNEPYIPKYVTKEEAINEHHWTDHPTGIDENHKMEWMTMRTKGSEKGSEWSAWTTPAPWSHWGVNGMDGDGVQYIYKRTRENKELTELDNPTPENWHLPDSDYQLATGEWYPSDKGWTDNPSGINQEYPKEWVCARIRHNGTWGKYSNPKLWSHYSKEVKSIISEYAVSKSGETAPFYGTWVSNSPAVTKDTPFLWKRHKTVYSDDSTFPKNTGDPATSWVYEMIGKQGERGVDGMDILYIFKLTKNKYDKPDIPSFAPGTEPKEIKPGEWTDDPLDVDSTYRSQWVTICKKKEGVWGNWSIPSLWSVYADDGVTIDLDNEMGCVLSNTKGELRDPNNNTAETNIFMHLGAKQLRVVDYEIMNDLNAAHIKCDELEPNYFRTKCLKFTINVDGQISPESNVINIKVFGEDPDDFGEIPTRFEGIVTFTFNKVVLGDNAVLYQIHPNYRSIKKHGLVRDGVETFEYVPDKMSCILKRTEGGTEGAEFIKTSAELDEANKKIGKNKPVQSDKSQIGYRMTYKKIFFDSVGGMKPGEELPYTPGAEIPLDVKESVKEVRFNLYFNSPDTPSDDKLLIDKEGILVVNDGVDGDGKLYIFRLTKDNEKGGNGKESTKDILIKELKELTAGVEPSDPGPGETKPVMRWTDNQQGINKTYQFEWVSMSTYDGKAERWNPWTEPKVWNKYVKDGDDFMNITLYTQTTKVTGKLDGGEMEYKPINADPSNQIKYNRAEKRWIPGIPAGWAERVDEDKPECYTWQTVGTFHFISDDDPDLGTAVKWTSPVRITGKKGDAGVDGDGMYYIYTLTEDNDPSKITISMPDRLTGGAIPNKPSDVTSPDQMPKEPTKGIWTDSPQGVSPRFKTEWCSIASYTAKLDSNGHVVVDKNNGKELKEWSDWGKPFVWSNFGEKGQDGDGVRYAFILKAQEEGWSSWGKVPYDEKSPQTPSTEWTDDPKGATKEFPYEYVSSVKYRDGKWGDWSKPSLWARWSPDGNYVEDAYKASADGENSPFFDKTAPNYPGAVPGEGWSPVFVSPTPEARYVWRVESSYDGKTQAWSEWGNPKIVTTLPKDGPPGPPGKGTRGPIPRMRGDWAKIPLTVNGVATKFESGKEGEEYIDLVARNVAKEGEEENFKKYKCINSHEKTDKWPESNWVEAEEFEFVATDLLMANDILAQKISLAADWQTPNYRESGFDTRIILTHGSIDFEWRKNNPSNPEAWKPGIKIALCVADGPDKGYSTLTFFDTSGTPLYDLGPRGLVSAPMFSPVVKMNTEALDLSIVKKNNLSLPGFLINWIPGDKSFGYYPSSKSNECLFTDPKVFENNTFVGAVLNTDMVAGPQHAVMLDGGNIAQQLMSIRFAIIHPYETYSDAGSYYSKIINSTDPKSGLSGRGSGVKDGQPYAADTVKLTSLQGPGAKDPDGKFVLGVGSVGSVAYGPRTEGIMYKEIDLKLQDQITDPKTDYSKGKPIPYIRPYAIINMPFNQINNLVPYISDSPKCYDEQWKETDISNAQYIQCTGKDNGTVLYGCYWEKNQQAGADSGILYHLSPIRSDGKRWKITTKSYTGPQKDMVNKILTAIADGANCKFGHGGDTANLITGVVHQNGGMDPSPENNFGTIISNGFGQNLQCTPLEAAIISNVLNKIFSSSPWDNIFDPEFNGGDKNTTFDTIIYPEGYSYYFKDEAYKVSHSSPSTEAFHLRHSAAQVVKAKAVQARSSLEVGFGLRKGIRIRENTEMGAELTKPVDSMATFKEISGESNVYWIRFNIRGWIKNSDDPNTGTFEISCKSVKSLPFFVFNA